MKFTEEMHSFYDDLADYIEIIFKYAKVIFARQLTSDVNEKCLQRRQFWWHINLLFTEHSNKMDMVKGATIK
jgi:hypothetical protein